jgi:hypothetical protein
MLHQPTGVRVGTAFHGPAHVLHAVACDVYAPALFDRTTVSSIEEESRKFRYALEIDTLDSVRFARLLAGFVSSRNACLPQS